MTSRENDRALRNNFCALRILLFLFTNSLQKLTIRTLIRGQPTLIAPLAVPVIRPPNTSMIIHILVLDILWLYHGLLQRLYHITVAIVLGVVLGLREYQILWQTVQMLLATILFEHWRFDALGRLFVALLELFCGGEEIFIMGHRNYFFHA